MNITKDNASEYITQAWEMLEGLSKQINLIYFDQIQGSRVMTQEEKHRELIDMLPALKGTVDSCYNLVDKVFDYLNDNVASEKR